jgi:hypothetical protein
VRHGCMQAHWRPFLHEPNVSGSVLPGLAGGMVCSMPLCAAYNSTRSAAHTVAKGAVACKIISRRLLKQRLSCMISVAHHACMEKRNLLAKQRGDGMHYNCTRFHHTIAHANAQSVANQNFAPPPGEPRPVVECVECGGLRVMQS